MIRLPLFVILLASAQWAYAQGNPPWRQPLLMARSTDGVHFSAPQMFQDSAGVPSAVRWKGDTLVCVFQWFRQPVNGPSWDRVAVRISPDNGQTWSAAQPILVYDLPISYQRPFDPTLAVLPDGRLRLYFSSSLGLPAMGLDSSINTYSANSTDGVRYYFEAGARVDHPTNRVIDPAVIYFNNSWHYTAPIGAPQQGAYHYVSPNGINFSPVPNIPSDPQHNWTGNFMLNSPQELRFYGTGQGGIWFNQSANGGTWTGYVPTNLVGGDPTALRLGDTDYLVIYVGPPAAATPVSEAEDEVEADMPFDIYPNPARPTLFITSRDKPTSEAVYRLFSAQGQLLQTGTLLSSVELDLRGITSPFVLVTIAWEGKLYARKVLITP